MLQSRCRLAICVAGLALGWLAAHCPAGEPRPIDVKIDFSGDHLQAIELDAGQTVEISVGIQSPSKLPANGRLAAEWTGPAADVGFRKVLHALDPDLYVVYRAPQQGTYTLSLSAVTDEVPPASAARWRESGVLANFKSFPKLTPWPAGHQVPVGIMVRPTDFGVSTLGGSIELEPNNSIAQAQPLTLAEAAAAEGDADQVIHVTGGADDIEYFDNGLFGESGDDWFRLEYRGQAPRLLSVNLMPTDPFVAARVRCYTPDGQEFTAGKHLNETAHEQVEEHRTAIVRTIEPGGVYLLRVEANSPGYDLEVRVRRPAPYSRSARGGAAGDVRPHRPGFRLADEPAARQQPRPPPSRHGQPVRHQLHELPHAVGRVGAGGAARVRLPHRESAALSPPDQHHVRVAAADERAQRRGQQHQPAAARSGRWPGRHARGRAQRASRSKR